MKLANNFEKILLAFNTHKVDFIVAGGYAVIFHGYGRTTGDLDIWVNPSADNKEKIIAAFKKLKLPSELNEYIQNIDFTKPFAVKLGNEPIQVDVFNAITGVKYDEAEKNSIPYKYSEKLEVRFIHLHDLMVNKMLTGRLKDKADVEELQKINIHSKNKNVISVLNSGKSCERKPRL